MGLIIQVSIGTALSWSGAARGPVSRNVVHGNVMMRNHEVVQSMQ